MEYIKENTNWHALEAAEAARMLGTDLEKGLSQEEAEKRLAEFGFNELEKKRKAIALVIFFNQFKNAFILLLIFAGALSLALGEDLEAIAIFGIILLNAVLGFFQEYKAEKAVEILEKMSAPLARVLRNGRQKRIPAKEIVPGDTLVFEAGDIVTADSRIIESTSLKIDEASLTGESVPSQKFVEKLMQETSIADQENMAFMGTVVTYGRGKSIVTSTGMKTEFGKIAASLQKEKTPKTPLEKKFEKLAKQIALIAVALVIIILLLGSIEGTKSFEQMMVFALALTVSTVPNSLPIIVTVSLSLGANRLAKKNMLVKKLSAAESLGAATIICADKTGTITKNQMTVTELYFDGALINVTGTGYGPKGSFFLEGKKIDAKKIGLLTRAGCLCNNAKVTEKQGKFEILGDPTEGALIVLGQKAGLEKEALEKKFLLAKELPFDSERKRMTTIVTNIETKKTEAYVKGAPDLLLQACDKIIENNRIRKLTGEDRKKILATNNSLAEKALRVIGFAYRGLEENKKYSVEEVEKNLVFIGLAGMIDPPREGVKEAIIQCQEAGIKVMIITGDHPITAKAIAKQIGLFKEGGNVVTGEEIDKMSDAELEEKIESLLIISRALPIQKLRVVSALKKKGHVVAMTGDGVNDAPALKNADIGIAMGITGTDIAKEVSKAILVDDNFVTIVKGIEEGRNIYDKIIKSAKYLLSCNSGEIMSVLTAVMLNFPLPLLPLQLLLMNLLTDDLPALGLGSETPDEEIMKRQPRNPKENPLSKRMVASIIAFGIIMMAGTIFLFMQYKDADLAKARTIAFTMLVMFQMFAVISHRSMRAFKKINPFSNKKLLGGICLSLIIQIAVIYLPELQAIFKTVPLEAGEWLVIIGIAIIGFFCTEIIKAGLNKIIPHSHGRVTAGAFLQV